MKYFFLILIMFTAIFFRFWDLKDMPPGLYPDEAMNGNNALEALETGNFKFFYPENNGREALFINIQALSVALFGNEPWALRGVSGIFGVLTVLGLYFLAKELFKNYQFPIKSKFTNFQTKKSIENLEIENSMKIKNLPFLINLSNSEIIALISSFLLATSFWHINFSRIGFRAIMAPAFLTWSLFLLLKVFNHLQLSFKNLNIKNCKLKIIFLLSGFVYGLGFHSYIAYRATPVLILLVFAYFWFKHKEARRQIFVSAILFFVAALVAISPLLFHFYQNPQDFLGRTSQISVFSSENPAKDLFLNTVKTVGMFWYQGDYNWRHNFAGEPQLFWPVGILFGIGILVSLFKAFKLKVKRNTLSEFLLLFWFTVGLLPVVISNEGLPHALRAIIVLPPVMIISGLALQIVISKINGWLAKQKENFPELAVKISRIQKEAVILLFLFFMGLAVQPYILYFMRYKTSPYISGAFSKNYVELGKYLNLLPKEKEKYVVLNASGTDVRGFPMPAQTAMFITKTFLPEWQKEKNLQYVLPQNLDQISCEDSCIITMLEIDSNLRQKIKEKINGLNTITEGGSIVLKK